MVPGLELVISLSIKRLGESPADLHDLRVICCDPTLMHDVRKIDLDCHFQAFDSTVMISLYMFQQSMASLKLYLIHK